MLCVVDDSFSSCKICLYFEIKPKQIEKLKIDLDRINPIYYK